MEQPITNLPPSNSDPSGAYDRLHPQIQRWIREQGWDALRDIQARSVDAILDGDADLIISASTASGKTEAAFLPILTLIAQKDQPGLAVLYISPLKALINDQFRRLETLSERLAIPVVRWHADAPLPAKKQVTAKPKGIVLITPESIEALFVRRPSDAHRLFGALSFVVIDELHSFMAGPRGLHLASLLKRIDLLAKSPARRVGLSATIGDISAAARWIRPANAEGVVILEAAAGTGDLKLQIRGYLEPHRDSKGDEAETFSDEGQGTQGALTLINDHLFATLRGDNNLVFAASRRTVEAIADGLRQRSERRNVPNEFFPHHGSLAKDLREPLEERLKAGTLPTTAVCTSTLELGVDIGSVASIAQIGAPRSMSSLRQRLGRSGRRLGSPAVLRIYAREFSRGPKTSPLDMLRPAVIRATAAIRLLLLRFVEPAAISSALATGLLHQTVSIIAERGGARAEVIFRILGGPGPFESVTVADFAELLRHVAGDPHRLIEQAPDGTLMLGSNGEKLVQSRDFFALFSSDIEWRIIVGGKTLGTIPASNAMTIGSLVVFAGRRWRIEAIDDPAKVLTVVPHLGGRIPKFDRLASEEAHDRLISEMRQVYEDHDMPAYLDQTAKDLLGEGRETYAALGMKKTSAVVENRDVHLFLWRGSAACGVFAVALAKLGLNAETHDFGVTIAGHELARIAAAIKKIADFSAFELAALGEAVKNLETEKLDAYVPRSILQRYWVQRFQLVLDDLPLLARELSARLHF